MAFWNVLTSIIPSAIAYTIPLLMGALGGLYSERSGVTDLCIEGLMLFGVFSSAATIVTLQAIPGFSFVLAIVIGIIVAMVASMLLSVLHAFAAINLKANQVISGTAINMLSTAITLFLAQTITGSGNITIVRGIVRQNVPILSKIPVIGDLFFKMMKVYVVFRKYSVVESLSQPDHSLLYNRVTKSTIHLCLIQFCIYKLMI